MARTLRLATSGLSDNIEGWGNSVVYGDRQIGSMIDPNGGHASRQITSIPSPFARMDLVRMAFKEVSKVVGNNSNNYPNIDQDTIYNKMVSDSLDVGQIFFDYHRLQSKVDILVWNRTNCLQALHDRTVEHEQVANTLELFLARDAATNNFDSLTDIYLLNYKNGPAELNIIGATSPRTLFFSNANDLSYVNDINFGQDIPFDAGFLPLYKRDIEYHKYLYALSRTYGFANRYPEVYDYITACYAMSDSNRKQQLNAANLQDYENIEVGGNAGVLVSADDNLLLKQKSGIVDYSQSDFAINSNMGNVKPLVLPVDTFTRDFRYTSDKWDPNTAVPKSDPKDLDNRFLPGDGSQYPYITIGDFFEDTFVRLPDTFNTKSFMGAGLDGCKLSALLPIKPLYFQFFTVNDLKKNLKVSEQAAGMKVTLTVPVKGGSIQYTRIYYKDCSPVIEENKGELLDFGVYFAMFPNLKFPDERYANYRFGLICDSTDLNEYSLHFMSGEHELESSCYQRNSTDTTRYKSSLYALDNKNFDYVQLSVNGGLNGIIVPEFTNVGGNAAFTFAIDFGTTNTHIEYAVNGSNSDDLDVVDMQNRANVAAVPNSVQLHFLADYGDTSDQSTQFYTDMIPAVIGGAGHNKYRFPMRTALSESSAINWNTTTLPYVHAGVAFTYEKIQTFSYNNVSTDLKWNNDANNQSKIKLYIESLFMLLKNRVLLGGGDLAQTKIVWFYPISMKQSRFNRFDSIWQEAYQKYFGNAVASNVIPMTESEAPYQYFHVAHNNVNNIVTIDIGGGTSDVVFANNGNIDAITSFRFAANSIFGDGYARGNVQHTGVVRQYESIVEDLLKQNNEDEILGVFNSLKMNGNSADMASFMFSIKDNISNVQIRDRLDYNKLLANDDDQRIVFLVFYTSMIYHVANIMKSKGLNMPNHIAFSGNGSKVISILTTNARTLSDYTKKIFEKVFDQPYSTDGLTIFHNQQYPKRATCKGGILHPIKQDYADISDKKIVLLGKDNSTFVTTETYGDLSDNVINAVVSEVKDFVCFAEKIIRGFDVENKFGVTQQAIDIAFGRDGVCNRDIHTFAQRGVANKKRESSDGEKIEETLFFYPISGVLVSLSEAICNSKIGVTNDLNLEQ